MDHLSLSILELKPVDKGRYLPKRRPIVFNADNLELLRDPHAWISSSCLDGCAILLQRFYPSPSIFVYQSYDMDTFRKDGREHLLWLNNYRDRFWEKDVWMIPTHIHQHWVVAIIRVPQRTVAVFDSFGSVSTCASELSAASSALLPPLTRKHGYDLPHNSSRSSTSWRWFPVMDQRLQHNTTDCGIWTLAYMATMLRGTTIAGTTVHDIARLRRDLFLYGYCMPMSS
ncbi:hypothetical protein C8Q80DRAFT_1111646 [Daedaleopsis nitida]|nr:hypothetical protein C8Q80DRAFT_1111646 [Daedaleopsis nitida]